MYLRKITTTSTLDWIMVKVRKAHRGTAFPDHFVCDKKELQECLAKYGWGQDDPNNKDKIGVIALENLPANSKMVFMGFFYVLYENNEGEQPKLWVVT